MAGFNTAVTGLKASTTLLDVAGNNIANASTVGFKSSRTEFGDIYATAVVGAGSSNTPGSGVTVTDIAQDFSGGTIEFTNSNLDLAINGSGFFVLDDGYGNETYTRAGAFELDKEGNIVSKNGKYLQGYGLDALGNQLPPGNLTVEEKESLPKGTERIELSFNIDSNKDATQLEAVFDKNDPSSYSWSTTVGTFDGLGNKNSIRFYFAEQRPVREVYEMDISQGDSFQSTVSVDLSSDDPINDTLAAGDTIAVNNILYTAAGGESIADVVAAFAGLDLDTFTPAGNFTWEDPAQTFPDVSGTFGTSTSGALTFTANGGFDLDVAVTEATPGTINLGATVSEPTATLANVVFEGLGMSTASALAGGDEAGSTLYWDDSGAAPWQLTDESKSRLEMLDPRIDADTFRLDAQGNIHFEVNAEYSQYGEFRVTVDGTTVVNSLPDDEVERSASEVQSFSLDSNQFTGVDGTLGTSTEIIVAGVTIPLPDGLDMDGVGATITSYEQTIIDSNPNIESVEYRGGVISVTWKSDVGDVEDPISVQVAGPKNPFVSDTNDDPVISEVYKGDNSYVGAYRTYAFFNDSEQLNIGRTPEPGTGSGADGETRVGPIMINFSSTTGALEAVNGRDVSSGGQAPSITILGADPANPEDLILGSDVDNLAGIQLDISGASQFASESIVKRQAQDGYTKGDLIGVSFSESGEMVASYSNGQRANLGRVVLATFENQDGLQPAGNTEWIATLSSGNAILNPPGTGLNGTLRSAALEQSNVDLSAELVKLIEGQRNFQANSKTLETLNTVTQAILQI